MKNCYDFCNVLKCCCKSDCHCPRNNYCKTGPQGPTGPHGPRGFPGQIGPTGPTGPTGDGQIVAYGGLFNERVTQIIVPPLNIMEELPMPNQMPHQNVVLGTNTITIVESGDYLVAQKFSTLNTGEDAFEVKISLRINGVLVPQMEHTLLVNIIAISDTSDIILRLNAGDVLDFVIFSEVGGIISFKPTITPALTVVKLGD